MATNPLSAMFPNLFGYRIVRGSEHLPPDRAVKLNDGIYLHPSVYDRLSSGEDAETVLAGVKLLDMGTIDWPLPMLPAEFVELPHALATFASH